MITKIAEKTARMLCHAGVIPEKETDLYAYGFFVLFSDILFFCVILVFGYLAGVLKEEILFFLQFLLLRGYAGGVHASKESTCLLCTTALLALSTMALRFVLEIGNAVLSTVVLLACSAFVFAISPLESAEKPLTKEAYSHFKKITRLLVTGITLLSLAIASLGHYSFINSATICMVLESVLLLAALVKMGQRSQIE